ncbi:putative CoA-binding protein [Legionella oakridgensis ATCC 33761 = DSM 21215]|uniref:CoA-binding protein n=3 Tax=Legionella oakridgensis TaxID=29423 RepID=A0A0W0WXX6_9GAMM|nr:putative CoA-binding protein [Legionella oakridgensis ATCC 33761 = DSM 21215]ETO93305.1 putative CoA-binding protein [Legionella oakridgensis RV-2-2007]KTD37170.1 CoA-binding protein [Legionella oakridgensis]STY20115.1 CoA-binding protein [Legionella longbeachae]
MDDKIKQFFTSKGYAVVGASTNREKYGNKVLRCYLQHHKKVIPVHPKETMIEGVPCVQTINNLPDDVYSISMVTPPAITEKIVEQAIAKGIKNIWMQPGAESEKAMNECVENNINVIANGPCILAVMGYKDR